MIPAKQVSTPFKSPLAQSHSHTPPSQDDLEETKRQIESLQTKLGDADVDETIKRHVELLNEYNAVKDGCTKVFDRIAEIEAVPSSVVWMRYGLDKDD
ncbi:uncharacterized protein PFL1_03414 [Pseudozyma flocculosa PF-1]|uniref:DNA repair protein Swi5/Sae3 n=2 Tax=Pseudozyma flocculosa TaxID=84751 RepID=A0A5C3F9Q4_9BASI|nr:uncharacterized protein PFL1_03414 [Pseudozyma flocculosa PF-1]EPQ29126.1 hypothetical protein PFL1_03414 [Pseudozyma flocculosa PF-1]SPO40121.1 uncharacterized protein PSFLO_05603 [Pseudozyma flocculosa]